MKDIFLFFSKFSLLLTKNIQFIFILFFLFVSNIIQLFLYGIGNIVREREKERERERDRERDRQTDRQTDRARETDRQTDRQTDRDRERQTN